MIMFVLLLLLATIILSEDKKREDDDCKDEEDFEALLEDMINQLHCKHLEITSNKSTPLLLLTTIHKFVESVQRSYEEKMARWKNELKKLKTLNENIQIQINQCNKEDVVSPLRKVGSMSGQIALERQQTNSPKRGNQKYEAFYSKETTKTIQENKPDNLVENSYLTNENIPQDSSFKEAPLFDLEQEVMNSPILRGLMENVKQEELSCTNFQPQRSNELCDDTELVKFLQRNCATVLPSTSNNFSKCSPYSKVRGTIGGIQESYVRKMQFADDLIKNNCARNQNYGRQRSPGVNNVQWYYGPNINKGASATDKFNPHLFEYKLRQQRTWESNYPKPGNIQSFSNCPTYTGFYGTRGVHDLCSGGSVKFFNCDLDSINCGSAGS